MPYIKILLAEEPTSLQECPFETFNNIHECKMDSDIIDGHIHTYSCVCTKTNPLTRESLFDFSKCPYCIALDKAINNNQ